MKESLKKWVMSFFVIVCCTSSIIKTYQVNLSFDSFFPITWYQKGLESSLLVWQTLVNCFDTNSDRVLLSFDLLLARLAFAQFCINRMYQESTPCLSDDNAYFVKVLDKVQKLLGRVIITAINHDFVLCAEDMLQTMRQQLGSNQ
jgi:hypothetical protein